MKKIFSIMALALATAMTFTACDDDDTVVVDPTANALKVVSQTTSFGAAQSTGTIVVDATDPVSVTSNAGEWLTTSVSGNTVTVNAEQNNSLEGRTATLTIQAGAKKTDISVIQSGAIFVFGGPEAISVNDNARTLTYSVKANLPVSFTSEADFISTEYNAEEGTVTIKLTKNDTGHIREGAIAYTCGDLTDEIPVRQCDFAKDLAGDYQLRFFDTSTGNLMYVPSTLKKTGSNYSIEVPSMSISIPVQYDSSTFAITMHSGQKVGTFKYQGKDYDLVTVAWDTNAGYLTWAATMSVTAGFYTETLEDGTVATVAEFEDTGTWPGYTIDAMRIELFSGTPYGSSTRAKLTRITFWQPYLVRFDEPAANASGMRRMRGENTPQQFIFSDPVPAGDVKVAL